MKFLSKEVMAWLLVLIVVFAVMSSFTAMVAKSAAAGLSERVAALQQVAVVVQKSVRE